MAFRQITVGTTPVRIVNWQKDRQTATIKNDSGSKVYILDGQANVVAYGFPLSVGEFASFINQYGDDSRDEIWAATAAATADLRIVEGYGELGK